MGDGAHRDVRVTAKNLTTVQEYNCTLRQYGNYYGSFYVDIDLASGDNRIEAIGTDDLGNTHKACALVTYNPAVEFLPRLSNLEVKPKSTVVNMTETFNFELQLYLQNERYIPDKVDLYECDIWGELLSKVGEMSPTGGIYSGTIQFMRGVGGDYYFRAVCDEPGLKGHLMQMSVIQRVFVHPSDEERQRAAEIFHTAFDTVFPSDMFPSNTFFRTNPLPEEYNTHRMKMLDRKINELCTLLKANPEVVKTEISPSRYTIDLHVTFRNGVRRNSSFSFLHLLQR